MRAGILWTASRRRAGVASQASDLFYSCFLWSHYWCMYGNPWVDGRIRKTGRHRHTHTQGHDPWQQQGQRQIGNASVSRPHRRGEATGNERGGGNLDGTNTHSDGNVFFRKGLWEAGEDSPMGPLEDLDCAVPLPFWAWRRWAHLAAGSRASIITEAYFLCS